ncbi:hypothetical protein ACKVMT_10615 [Halobacteriales archaeon Cl-PHB]
MRRSILVLVVVAVLASVPVAGAVVGGSSGSAPTTLHDANASNDSSSVAPGQQLSGVVGVQQAELEGQVETRAAGLAIANASTDAAKAAVVAGQYDTIQERLNSLEQRKNALQAAHANGSLSDGAYRARMAELAARTEAVRHLADQTATVGERLPPALLAERGVNATAISGLSARAGELSGPEVAEIARSIAGPVVGAKPVGGSPGLNISVGADGNVSVDPPGPAPVGNGDGGSSDGTTDDTTVTPTEDDILDTNVTDTNLTDDNETLDDTF